VRQLASSRSLVRAKCAVTVLMRCAPWSLAIGRYALPVHLLFAGLTGSVLSTNHGREERFETCWNFAEIQRLQSIVSSQY